MSGFILLILSLILVLCSSYFTAALFQSRRPENSYLFWILIIISQVILSFEVLSLLKQINIPAFIIFNIIIFAATFLIWNYKNRPALDTDRIKKLYKNIKNALKNDRILFFLLIFFIFASTINLFLAIYAPVNVWDAMSYQVARVAFWIQNETLAHFETSSVRQVMFPPNSDLLLLWIMLFIKRDFLLGMVQYLSCFASILVIYSFLSYLKISTSRILWTIFIFASLPAIIVHSSGTQNHIIPGFLILSSLYLFIYGVFENEKKSLFFSAIALGISIGTKSSVFLFLPGIFIAYLLIAIKKHGRNFYKTAIRYSLYLTAVFILLSSYFYVMNFLEFGHLLGVKSYIHEHTFMGKGIKSFAANLIRYISVFIDFTGIDPCWQTVLSFPVHFARTVLFSMLGLSRSEGLTHAGELFNSLVLVNTSTHELRAGLGPLGFLLLLPLLALSAGKYVFSRSKRTFLIGTCGIIFIVFIITISAIMGYEIWNNRYFITAAVISAPVFALSYPAGNKINFKKLFIFGVCIFSFVKIPLFNELRPVLPVKGLSLLVNSREDIRYNSDFVHDSHFRDPVVYLQAIAPAGSRIGVIFPDNFWYYQFFAQNQGWEIYPLNLEFLTDKKLKSLDFLVVYGNEQKLRSIKEHKNFNKKIKIDFNRILGYFKSEYLVKTRFDREKYNKKFYIFSK